MAKPYVAQGGKPIFREFQTPIGLVCHAYHDKPQLKTKDEAGRIPDIDPQTGIQFAEWKFTLAWHKSREAELQSLVNLAMMVKGEAWPESSAPGAFFALEPFFRDGDNPQHNTKNKDYLRERYYLNFKQKATATLQFPNQPVGPGNPAIYGGAPGLLGPLGPEDIIMPVDVYPGCTGRVSGIMFGTEYMGKNFISVRLNNFQKYEDGDRIGGGGRPSASSQFTALKTPDQVPPQGMNQFGMAQQPQQGYGVPPQGGIQQPVNQFGNPINTQFGTAQQQAYNQNSNGVRVV